MNKKRLQKYIQELQKFEQEYGMMSDDFYDMYEAQHLPDIPEFRRWRNVYLWYREEIDSEYS